MRNNQDRMMDDDSVSRRLVSLSAAVDPVSILVPKYSQVGAGMGHAKDRQFGDGSIVTRMIMDFGVAIPYLKIIKLAVHGYIAHNDVTIACWSFSMPGWWFQLMNFDGSLEGITNNRLYKGLMVIVQSWSVVCLSMIRFTFNHTSLDDGFDARTSHLGPGALATKILTGWTVGKGRSSPNSDCWCFFRWGLLILVRTLLRLHSGSLELPTNNPP